MGTRSTTLLIETYKDESGKQKKKKIVVMYRQFDGYPSGHGQELAEFLSKGKLVNGMGMDDNIVFNGMGCLAAQMIVWFKKTPGGFYIHPVVQQSCGQDYEYHILNVDGQFKIEVYYCGCNMFGMSSDYESEVIFSGSLPEFIEFCKEKETA